MNLSALEAKVTSDEGKQELNRLKMALNEAELLKQKYSSAPAAIDFAAYKGKVDAEIAAKNTRLAAHDAESRTGSEEYQRLKTPRAAKKPARSVSDGEK